VAKYTAAHADMQAKLQLLESRLLPAASELKKQKKECALGSSPIGMQCMVWPFWTLSLWWVFASKGRPGRRPGGECRGW
jgi:hypothetical protein